MEQEPTEGRSVFLSTAVAERNQRRLAATVVFISFALFLGAVPFAKVALLPIAAFIPAYESALVVNDLITAVLLFGQFNILRAPALRILASGYLFTALIAVVHALTFPGLFAQNGLLGAGMQTTAWLYMFWHGGFPVFVIAYARLKDRPHDKASQTPLHLRRAIFGSLAAVFLGAAVITFWTTKGQRLLPVIMDGHRYTPAMVFVVSSVWSLSLIALVTLWRTRPHSVIDVWLMVVMCAWLFDVALSAVLNGGRFDLGFYAGRIYGLMAASFVLIVLLLENGFLYAKLAEAHERERGKSDQLAAANQDLESFSYSVSHDLRAPLRAVDGFSQALEEQYGETMDVEARRLLGIIRGRTQFMGQLIEDLLAFSRLGRQALHTKRIDLDHCVRGYLEELQPEIKERSIQFAVHSLGTVQADPALLKQVWMNLLGNAIKFTRRRTDAAIEIGTMR
ncbi:MAG TPA: MASE4 domain-containing protein, partial [Polyangia bacterium]|nr:MASE4 domain-containing protein [Polyangia bacterium]